MSDEFARRRGTRSRRPRAPRFRLPIYEGPLDLLLHLIKRAELDAREVTASVITEQYLAYLELLDSLNLDVAGEYLVMAATLLLIKSFSMLPHAGTEERRRPRNSSATWSRGCSSTSAIARRPRSSAERALLGRDVFAAPGEKLPEEAPEERPERRSSTCRCSTWSRRWRRCSSGLTDTTPREIELRDIPVAECIPRIMAALEEGGGPSGIRGAVRGFSRSNDRSVVIATFMALLELIRQGRVRALQEHRYGPILLERREQAASGETPPPAPAGGEQQQ